MKGEMALICLVLSISRKKVMIRTVTSSWQFRKISKMPETQVLDFLETSDTGNCSLLVSK